jgi:dephospho-CoA kinase
VDAILEKPSTVGQGTKREVIETAVRNGRAIVEKMVEDTAAKKRDREAVDRVSRAGYMLGLSNENIPVVKAGLEAQARLKADKYQKPEYRMYSDSREDGPFREISKTEYDYAQSVKSKPGEAAAPAPTTEAAPTVKTLPNGWTNTRNGFTDRPVYRFNQGTGQPFAVVTETDDGYEVQVRHGDKQVSVEKMPGASRAEALSSASGMLAEVSTHKDPGEKSEAVTPTVVADAMKKAARNEDVKPADMKKWLLAELDKAMLEAPDREDYDATVKSFSAKDAEKMWTGNGPYGKDTHTGFLSFDVPGDGKFKVRNGMRGLLEFKQNVERSKGFSNTGARTAAPERNNGVQDGSGGRMSAITNMIDEGDFEAARDYAEAVGIKLEDVRVPRGDMKPAWEKYLKDGTLPAPPDTKPQPAPKTAAQADMEGAVADGFVQEVNPFAEYDAVAKQYGYEVRPDGMIGKDGKFPGPKVSIQKGRLRVESSAGNLLGSYAATPASIGKFLEAFWYAEKSSAPAQQEAKNPARAVADGFVEQAAAESDYASTAKQVEAAQELLLPIRQGEMITDDVRQTLESLLKIPSLKGFDQPTARRLLMIAGATKAAIEKVMRTNPVSIDDLATELGKATGEAEKKKAFDRAFNAASQIAQTDPKVKDLLDIYNVEKSILDGIASERGLYGMKWAERNVSSRWTGQSQKVRSVKQRLVDAVNKAAPSGIRRSFAGQQAATADQHALTTAQQRLEVGEDAETVRQETGWFTRAWMASGALRSAMRTRD